MNNTIKRCLIYFSIPFFASLFLVNIYFFRSSNGGGPTATLSHTNDRPNSYAPCSNNSTGIRSVGVLSNGTWSPLITTDSPWLTLINAGTTQGNGFVQYTLEKNFNPYERAAVISIGGQTFTIVQEAFDQNQQCPIDTNPPHIQVSQSGGGVEIFLDDHGFGQTWQIEREIINWLESDQTAGTGSGSTYLRFSPNYSGATRMTTIKVSGKTIPIIQGGTSR